MLLDTCALLWLAKGDDRLPESVLEQIDLSSKVYISAITGFEISLKYRKGKLKLPVSPEQWFKIIVEYHDLTVISLDLDICIASTGLPPFHKDPCDRFIIATAMLNNLPIVTSDKRFKEYKEYGVELVLLE